MKRFMVVVGLVAILSACGSSVKLDNVPVEDRSAASMGTTTGSSPNTGTSDGSGIVL